MLGLDANTLAVADYEIIARIERIITAFNATGILPVHMQQVNRVPTPLSTNSQQNYEFISSQYDSSSSMDNRPGSPNKRHHHTHAHHARERSVSPHRSQHHNHHHHHHQHEENRHRSKSPRKNVTIDPNSY